MPKITIEFDREKGTHSLEIDGLNGKELLLAIQSLTKVVEEKIGMPIEMAMIMAKMEEEGKDDS